MEGIINTGWAQFGFAFLCAISGWVAAWIVWKERVNDRSEYWQLVRQSIETNTNVNATLQNVLRVIDCDDYENPTPAGAGKSVTRRRA